MKTEILDPSDTRVLHEIATAKSSRTCTVVEASAKEVRDFLGQIEYDEIATALDEAQGAVFNKTGEKSYFLLIIEG